MIKKSKIRKRSRMPVTKKSLKSQRVTVSPPQPQSASERRLAMQEVDAAILQRLGNAALLCWED